MYDRGSQPPVFDPDVTTKHGCPPNGVASRPSDAAQHAASSPPSVKQPVPDESGVRGEIVTGGGGGEATTGDGEGGGGFGVGGGGGCGDGGDGDELSAGVVLGLGVVVGAVEVVVVVSRLRSAKETPEATRLPISADAIAMQKIMPTRRCVRRSSLYCGSFTASPIWVAGTSSGWPSSFTPPATKLATNADAIGLSLPTVRSCAIFPANASCVTTLCRRPNMYRYCGYNQTRAKR